MQNLVLFLIGAILIVLGITNIKGNISSIHWYNRRKVQKEDVLKYGRCVGIGTLIIGIGIIVAGILDLASIHYIGVILASVIAGLLFILFGQFKYNKGIF